MRLVLVLVALSCIACFANIAVVRENGELVTQSRSENIHGPRQHASEDLQPKLVRKDRREVSSTGTRRRKLKTSGSFPTPTESPTSVASCSDTSDSSHKICSIPVRGTTRWFDLATPDDLSSVTYPVVFAFHGGGIDTDASRIVNGVYDPTQPPDESGKLESVGDSWGWSTMKNDFIFVVPHGQPDDEFKHQWQYGKFDTQTDEDFEFIDSLLDFITSDYPTHDSDRIFAYGHSSGGIFLYAWITGGPKRSSMGSYTIQNTNPWKALALSGSSMVLGGDSLTSEIVDAPSDWSLSSASKPVSLHHTHGDADESVPFAMDAIYGSYTPKPSVGEAFGYNATKLPGHGPTIFFREGCHKKSQVNKCSGRNFYPVHRDADWTEGSGFTGTYETSIRKVVTALGCTARTTSSVTAPKSADKYQYSSCTAGTKVEVLVIAGGSHSDASQAYHSMRRSWFKTF